MLNPNDPYIKTSKILVVDDNPVNVLLLEKMLRLHDFQDIETVTDSRKVCDVFLTYKPDLLLLDLKMPYVDGFTVLKWIRDKNPNSFIPVIVITAQNDRESKLEALSMGAQDFIGKPFDHTEVLTRINNLLKIKSLHSRVEEDNYKLEQKVEERTKEIQDLQMEIIERLMRATEFRDEDTGEHIVRIGRYSYILAKKIGLSEEEARMIFSASKMHDIGKVGIPDQILLKPGKLSEEEVRLMKAHTTTGAQILAGSSYEMIKIAEQIAFTHHEKWDGSGYPNGLKGEEIPLVGRITALVDVFDALTTVRPYKQAWPLETAIAYIKERRGVDFDPTLVDAFLDAINDMYTINNLSSEEIS